MKNKCSMNMAIQIARSDICIAWCKGESYPPLPFAAPWGVENKSRNQWERRDLMLAEARRWLTYFRTRRALVLMFGESSATREAIEWASMSKGRLRDRVRRGVGLLREI